MAEPTLRQIRMFLAVARCGSFRAAADETAATQSSLSIQIKALEARVGVALFDRTARTVRLTAAGGELLADFERVAAASDELRSRAAQIALGQTGQLRIAALPSIAATLLPETVARLHRDAPGVHVHILEAVEQTLVASVKAGHCDLGLTSAHMLEHGMDFEALYRDELVAVMVSTHRLACQRRIAIAQLAGQALILTRRSTSLRHAIDRAFAEAGISNVLPDHEVGTMATALSFAAHGLGIALLPVGVARSIRSKNLVIRALADGAGSRVLGVLQRHSCDKQPLSQRFVELLREVVTEVVPRRLRVTVDEP